MRRPAPGLLEHLQSLDPDAPRAVRHLWLRELLDWIRSGMDGDDPAGAVARVGLLLDAIALRPDWPARWTRWWQVFTREIDLAPLLADYGFAPRTAFLSALGERLGRHLLPATPDTDDPGALMDLLLDDPRDVRWLGALDGATLRRLGLLLQPGGDSPGWGAHALLDALQYAAGQVVATGFSTEIRLRMAPSARQRRPFQALGTGATALADAVRAHGAHSEPARAAGQALRSCLHDCELAAETVYEHLDEHGISVGIVFRLRQLRERAQRIRRLLDTLQGDDPPLAAARLLAHLAQAGQDKRSIRRLVASSTQLTAARVAERGAETGEHYITRTRAEYRHMLATSAGGGAVLAFTTWGKFALVGLGLPAFWAGLAAGLNYALSFVVIMLLHWTVATKQPAFTAAAMAARLRDMAAPDAVERFVDEMVHLLRSQIAAIVGNLGAVVPVVLLLCLARALAGAPPMLDEARAHHVLQEQSLLGPSALFAAGTGVLLFVSSLVAGWTENAFVLHRIDSAITWNPRITRWLGPARAARAARWLRRHVSGLAANVSLGLLLGLVPAFAAFFGLGLEVRHVTLATGQVSAALATLGPAALATPAFGWAVAGLAVIGLLNLGVSFFLAFRVALAAHGTTDVDRGRIYRALGRRLRRGPLTFLRPPADPAPADHG